MLVPTRKTVAALAVGAATAAQLVAFAPAALAETAPPPAIEVMPGVHEVTLDGDTATATGTYRCQPDVVMTHVWVSLKKAANDLSGEGSGARANSWYDTNVSLQGEEPVLTCDGQWHELSVPLGRYPDKQPLQAGRAWLQFCLYAASPSAGFNGATDNGWTIVKPSR